MIVEFRAAVAAVCDAVGVPVHHTIPDDLVTVPCVVVGRPDAGEGDTDAVMDLSLDVWVIGRRVDAGAPELELDTLADAVVTAFGGTRGVSSAGQSLHVPSWTAATVEVAGLVYPAYQVTTVGSMVTC